MKVSDNAVKWLCVAVVGLVVGLAIACGGGGSGGSSSGGEESSGDITLTGTLATGALAPSAWTEAGKIMVADDYTVVAVNNETNETYSTTASSGEEFDLDVPSDATYLVSIINSGTYIGPVIFDGSGSEANAAITPSSSTALGSITLDTTDGYAMPATVPDCVNTDVTCVASSGQPLGAGNGGKTQNSAITNRSDSDKDQDGIANIFDADEDNDGIRNGVATLPSSVEVVSDVVESVFLTSNIWADHNTASAAKDIIALWLNVVAVSGQESLIASVQCTDVPSSIQAVATVRFSDSLGSPTGYPTENSLWSAASYNLYKTTTLPTERWIVSITPKAIMEVGDTFTIRVTYTDSTYEDFFATVSYVLTDWARVSTYNGTAMPVEGTKNDPVTYAANTLEIVFSKPLDEDGIVLQGLSYSLRYGESTQGGGGTWSVPATVTEDSVTDTGGATLTHTITTTTSATYYVTPVAESADGQRNGEETWFTRQ